MISETDLYELGALVCWDLVMENTGCEAVRRSEVTQRCRRKS